MPLRDIDCVAEQEAVYVEAVLEKAMGEAQRRLGKEFGALLEIQNDGTVRVLVSRGRVERHRTRNQGQREPRGTVDGADPRDEYSMVNLWVAGLLPNSW